MKIPRLYLLAIFGFFSLGTFIYNVEANNLDSCETCEKFIDTARVFLQKGNETIIPMIKVIAEICHKIYGPAAKECYAITNNTDKWIDNVLNNSSLTICHEMKQC